MKDNSLLYIAKYMRLSMEDESRGRKLQHNKPTSAN